MIDTVYREMRSALGFGRLWFTIEDDGTWLFVWHPDRDHTVEHRVIERDMHLAREPAVMSRHIGWEMRRKYEKMVTEAAKDRPAPA